MAQCPNCKSERTVKVKEWEVRPKTKKGPALHVTLYNCEGCKKKFRVAKKI